MARIISPVAGRQIACNCLGWTVNPSYRTLSRGQLNLLLRRRVLGLIVTDGVPLKERRAPME